MLSDIVDVPSPLDDVAPVKTEEASYVMVFSTTAFAQTAQQKKKKSNNNSNNNHDKSKKKNEDEEKKKRKNKNSKQQEGETKKTPRTTGTIITLISDKQWKYCDF